VANKRRMAMHEGSRTINELPLRSSSKVATIQEPGDVKARRNLTLVRARKDLNRATARRIVDNEADELLTRLRAAVEDAEEAKALTAIASWSGSEREDALRLSLQQLKEAAVL
jgi:hypothetical protein